MHSQLGMHLEQAVAMATRKQNTLKREPADEAGRGRTGLQRRDIEDEAPDVEREDDASDFFEESDDYPGDRRRDPLRRP